MKHEWLIGVGILVVFLTGLYFFMKWRKSTANTQGGGGYVSDEKKQDNTVDSEMKNE